mgnify:CR=1 FL=1|tara:strand:- start:3247 stop:3972 length:726 start_codon:yes stop_codon:yes gene_type:complete
MAFKQKGPLFFKSALKRAGVFEYDEDGNKVRIPYDEGVEKANQNKHVQFTNKDLVKALQTGVLDEYNHPNDQDLVKRIITNTTKKMETMPSDELLFDETRQKFIDNNSAAKFMDEDLKDLRPNDKFVDLDKAADMPVKRSGFGPRAGNVPNPEMQGISPKPKKKVMKNGPKTNYTITTKDGTRKGTDNWTNPYAVKSDAQKKSEAKKAEYAKMTDAQKKALQDAANDKADKFHKRGKYATP